MCACACVCACNTVDILEGGCATDSAMSLILTQNGCVFGVLWRLVYILSTAVVLTECLVWCFMCMFVCVHVIIQ